MTNKINLNDNLWELFISYSNFKKEIERICIQTNGVSGGLSEHE